MLPCCTQHRFLLLYVFGGIPEQMERMSNHIIDPIQTLRGWTIIQHMETTILTQGKKDLEDNVNELIKQP